MTAEFWFANAALPQGWAKNVAVTVRDGRIFSVMPGAAQPAAAERHAIALPGMPNLHSHAFQRGMAGLAETRGPGADSFWTWRETMYRFIDVMTPDDMQAIAEMAYVEMLESGFTHVAEFHYLHHGADGQQYADKAEMSARIAAASDIAGIGLTLLPVFYAHAGFGGQPPAHGQRRFINSRDDFAVIVERCRALTSRLSNARTGVAPHSLRAVTPEELSDIVAMAAQAPVHIHVAEQTREVEDCLAWSSQRPVAWLMAHQNIDARWCLIHATHMVAEETAALAKSGAVAGLCPITEANLGDGLFPAPDFRAHHGRFGVGSDSNVRIAMPAELEMLEYGQRLTARSRNVFGQAGESTGRALFDAALTGGAQACGIMGGLQPGASADFLTLRADHPALAAARPEQYLDALVFGAHDLVEHVWRNGQRRVSDGRHKARSSIEARYRKAMTRMTEAA